MGALWQIRLFGRLEARQGTTVISRFATSRVAALLARLALLPHRAHSREELAGLLWPDADEDAGRLNLRVALSALRHQMEPPGTSPGSVLITDRVSIGLNSQACTSDAAQFEAALREAARAPHPARKREHLDKALALYDGDLLPGFYDEWVLEERERLQAQYEEAVLQHRALISSVSDAAPVPTANPAPDTAPLAPTPDASPAPDISPAPRALLNFPGQFTRFFGRTAEQRRLAELLADPAVRLVTLLGPGGSGKTRLAQEAARQAAETDGPARFDGPICFAALADISDSALLPSTVADALRLTLSGGKTAREQVAAFLESGRSLIVLDNLEHLGEGGAAEIGALLEAVPGLTCLVTSRQTLHLAGEQALPLAPLPVPAQVPAQDTPAPDATGQDATGQLLLDTLADYPGVQLFVDRARLVRPEFALTPRNAPDVAAVCRALEGLPLALELAAARMQALSPGQMRRQLDARLDFLVSRSQGLPPRHRSLRAALEWSVHLLSPEQTRFFTQLSVFRGGWTLAAAAAVCEVPNPLDLLEQLCERSLIVSEEALGEASGETRFRMLESLREFGEEQLSPDEKQALSRRHAAYFHTLAADMNRLWNGLQQNIGLEALTADYDNLRAALSFCRADPPDAAWNGTDTGLRLAAALGSYWTTRGLIREGLDWLNGALSSGALAGGSAADARAAALTEAGWLAAGLSDFAGADTALTEAVSLSRSLGDTRRLASTLRLRGTAFIWKGDYSKAEADLEEALRLCRALGDDWLLAANLNSLGVLANEWKGDNDRSRVFYEEALPLFLRLGDQQRAAYCLHNLGNIAHDDGDFSRAEALLRHSLSLADTLGDAWHRAYCLRSLGDVSLAQEDMEQAAALLEEGSALCGKLGDRMTEAGTRLSLARVRRRQGEFALASAEAQAALRLYKAVDRAAGLTECWMNLAETATAQADWPQAAALLSAADACRTEFANESKFPNDGEQERAAALCHAARAALSPAVFATAWERGRTLTCDNYGLR